jgi:hypothetical protein
MPLTEAQAEALVDQLADDAALLHGDAETEVVTEGGIVPSVAKVIASAEEALTGPVAVAEGWADKAEAWAETPEDDEVEAGKYSARHWAAKAQAVRDSLGDVMVFRGAFDASTGSYPSNPVQGDLYTVTVSGSVGGTALVAGDEIIYGPAGWILVGRNRSASEIVALITGNFTDGAHGPRGGGALHAPATTSVAGFMSAADKSYLDSLPDALSAKANASDVASALAEKADASAVTSALAEKADASAVTSALAEKADSSDVATDLNGKLDDPEANGIVVRTGGDGASVARTITGTANQVVVSNGDGVSGNPTLSLPQDIDVGAAPTFAALTLSGGTLIRSSVAIADDNVLFVPLAFNTGRLDMIVGGQVAAARCVPTLSFRCTGSPYCRKVVIDQGITDPIDVTLGALSAGGGADGKITVSTDSDPQGIYISNRMGATISVVLFFWRAA